MKKFKIVLIMLTALCFIAGGIGAASVPGTKERSAEVVIKIDLKAPSDSKDVRLWVPYPVSDENQDISNVRVEGNYTKSGVYKENEFGDSALYAEWTKANPERKLIFSFKVKRKEVFRKDFPAAEPALNKNEFNKYLKDTRLVPIHGTVKETAEQITKDKKTTVEKARAIYDYIVDNWERDPSVKGCGTGDVLTLLDKKKGKCVDVHSVYVAFARAAGIPAREVSGIKIPKDKEGNMTTGQSCWAEFYAAGYGWVPIDPANVLKIVLTKKIKKEDAKEYRDYYFGAIDENRIAYGTGRDMTLNPPQKSGKLNYFMYPCAEIEGKQLDHLEADAFKYTISYKEL